jgi:hypothetical protein
MSKLYNHTFFKWWEPADISELEKTLKVNYQVTRFTGFESETEVSPYRDERNELEVKSENVVAFLSLFRATLTQLCENPITVKDIELRNIIKDNYPRDRPTPFPWEWNPEPKIE